MWADSKALSTGSAGRSAFGGTRGGWKKREVKEILTEVKALRVFQSALSSSARKPVTEKSDLLRERIPQARHLGAT